jgi:hypothetical protein
MPYPQCQESPPLSTAVMINGPMATPSPKKACSQFMCFGPKAPAA